MCRLICVKMEASVPTTEIFWRLLGPLNFPPSQTPIPFIPVSLLSAYKKRVKLENPTKASPLHPQTCA